jgi:hypothetical protein
VNALKALGFAVAIAVVFAATSLVTRAGEPKPRTREDLRVLARLDEHTKNSDRTTRNTIPAFLALRGSLGVLRDEEDIEYLSPDELQKGVCTPSLARLIRARYPGSYDDVADALLERRVIAKHPEYRDVVCWLPAWIPAEPHEIVKYEWSASAVAPRRPLDFGWRIGITAAVAALMLGLNYSGLIELVFAARGRGRLTSRQRSATGRQRSAIS